jgi:hypothetical protein
MRRRARNLECRALNSLRHCGWLPRHHMDMMPHDTTALARQRLFYAERCENLIKALQFTVAVLRGTPAGENATREAVADHLNDRS